MHGKHPRLRHCPTSTTCHHTIATRSVDIRSYRADQPPHELIECPTLRIMQMIRTLPFLLNLSNNRRSTCRENSRCPDSAAHKLFGQPCLIDAGHDGDEPCGRSRARL